MANQSPPESELFSVFEQFGSSRTRQFQAVTPLRVAVLALDRYLSDARTTPLSYSYDVTITDGKWRVKCLLAPALNRLVQVNALRCGACALISRLSVVYDETRLGRSCVCVEEARSDSTGASLFLAIKDTSAIRLWTHESMGSVVAVSDAPLQSTKHYLALWNNEDPHGAIWAPDSAPPEVVIDVSRICFLGDLEAFNTMSRQPFPVLVRVLHRSRLRYYGKPGQNIEFPFQAYFEVADQSGVMSMVLWNELCPEWYQRLSVGSVLYVKDYKLKRSYQNRTRPQLSTPLMSFTSTEISLNPHRPSAVITVIPPNSVQPQWNLPQVTYDFFTRCEVESLANNQVCDIIGLVMYVSRVERLRNGGNAVPEKFWTYQWVHAVDGTSESPFILEIFASSQPEIFNSICPMSYLVCTHMRVCRETGLGSALYLTSSVETQLFVTGFHRKQPYISEPKVKAFIQWTKTQKDGVVMKKTTVGGQYCYPPLPPTFTPDTISTGANQGGFSSLMAVGDLQKELERLQYREHIRLAVQGHITAVQYHRWPPEAPHTTPQNQQQVEEHGMVSVAGGSTSSLVAGAQQSETSSDSSRGDVVNPLKRGLQRQYWTRARRKLERMGTWADLHEDVRKQSDEEDSGALPSPSPSPADNSETGSISDTQQSPTPPVASWESSVWPLLKQNVTDHVRCAPLDHESIPEKFNFAKRDIFLHRLNLSPAKWHPDMPTDADPEHARIPVTFPGYLRLTLLGLNQQAAVDSLFLPVFCDEDPRAVGMSHNVHDNTLTSWLSTGRICTQADFSPETVVSSASALEDERVVCVLDACLLGENRLEILCTKVYRMADINISV